MCSSLPSTVDSTQLTIHVITLNVSLQLLIQIITLCTHTQAAPRQTSGARRNLATTNTQRTAGWAAMHAYTICISQSYWYCETHIVVYIYVAERLIQREHCNVKGGGGSPCFDKMAEFLRTPAISLIFWHCWIFDDVEMVGWKKWCDNQTNKKMWRREPT